MRRIPLAPVTDQHTIEYWSALHREALAHAKWAGLCGEPSYAMGEVCVLQPDHDGKHESRTWTWNPGEPMSERKAG